MRSERQKTSEKKPMVALRTLIAFSLFFLVSLSPCLLVSLSPCQGEEAGLPPIRRRLLSPERLPQELKRVREGVLVRLPLAEFDARVERAVRASAPKIPPRLLEARYRAALKEQAFVGDGQWKLIHTGPTPGLMHLEPFNLAVRQARFENGDALIASFDDKTPALLVEAAGEQTVFLEWSARAEAEPDGLRFHLEVPPCPVALLELDVPAGRTVSLLGASDDSLLLSGPHAADSADLRRWKIVWRGRDKIDFLVRPADRATAGADSSPVLFVRQKTTQKLNPEGLDATFELTLEAFSRGVRELVCECDAELRLREVVGPNVDGCSFQAGSGNKPSRLTIRLREPVREGTWQIFCLAPLNSTPISSSRTIVWRSPGLRLLGGVPRGETLTLGFHPDLRVEGWNPGSFRLLNATSATGERQRGMQQLTLLGGGLRPEGSTATTPPRRPEARLQAYGVEFRARQLAWWRCDANGIALTLQIGYEVSHGQLFQLPIVLPAGYALDRVEMSPASLLRNAQVRTKAGKSTLYVELTRPLVCAEQVRREGKAESAADGMAHSTTALRARVPTLTVHLRPAWSGPIAGRTLAFPDAVPLGARFREGALALDCDEQLFHLDVRTTAERSEAQKDGPWGQQLPEYSYRYRGHTLEGKLLVQPRPPRWRAKCTSEVFIAAGQAALRTHLLLEADIGSPDTIDLSLSASDGEPWTWRNDPATASANRVLRAERLYARETADALRVLAARTPMQAAALHAMRPLGERWRLTLARPLRTREPLRLSATRHLKPRGNRWHVPLPVVRGAGRMEGEVKLHLAGADLVQMRSVGLRETASTAAAGATPWRTFRYGENEVALTLWGQALATDRAAVAVVDRARLITSVSAEGVVQHHFTFQVANWGQRTLPVRLPSGARLLAVQVDGHWLPRLVAPSSSAEAAEDEAKELAFPVPGSDDATSAETVHRFTIVYTRTLPSWRLWQSIAAPAPVLPVTPLAFRRSWRLPVNLTPLNEGRCQAIPGPHDSEPVALPRHVADLFRLPGAGPRFDPLLNERHAAAREALARAAESLRGSRADRGMSLGEVLSEIAFVHLKDRYPVVVDALALREAGIDPQTPLTIKGLSADDSAPPWDQCGLVALPVRAGILLTTVSGRGAALREPVCEAVENAVAVAIAHGQDSSSRFHSALHWLRPESNSVAPPPHPQMLALDSDLSAASEWEPVAGLTDDTLIVVRRDLIVGLGLVLTLLLVLFFWLIRRRSVRWRRTLLFGALGLAGVGVFWLPNSLRNLAWWPLLVGCVGVFAWYVKALARRTRNPKTHIRKPKSVVAGTVPALVFLLAALGWNGRAAAPAPVTVYLVPGPADAPENQTVLAPADLLDRLKALARPAPLVAGGPQAVLIDATYDGKLVDNQAEFAAVFSVHCLSDEPATLAVPLAGVQLVGDVWLDGAPADPLALAAPQSGYSLQVRGLGRHKVELRFRAPVAGTPEDRNVLFSMPPLARSRLNWRVPPGASDTQALVKRGAQRTVRQGSDERLEVDLGNLPKPIHLHWYQAAQPAPAARLQYRAAYLWDLHVEASQLTAWLRYRVLQGAVKTLEVDLPADLDVRSADARRTAPASAPAWMTRFHLRDWHVATAGGKRTLHLEFPYPIVGDFQVTLELIPRAPLSALVTLSLPAPRGERAAGSHFLAYRTDVGLEAQRDTSQNITRIRADEFAPDWPGVARLAPSLSSPRTTEDRIAGAAYKISPAKMPTLRLRLRRRPPAVQAEIDVTVQAGPQLAEVQAIAKLTAPNKDLGVVEWDLQPSRLTVASVTGDDVRAWKQIDRRLLVWLHRTTGLTQLRLSGWLPLDRRGGQAHLDLPCLRLPQARAQHTRFHLVAAAGLTLAAVNPHNLQAVGKTTGGTPVPPGGAGVPPGGAGVPPGGTGVPPVSVTDTSERERTFETRQSNYGGSCEIQSAANAAAHVLTFAEIRDRRVQFTTTVNYDVGNGELRRVHLRLRNWVTEKIKWEADRVARSFEPRRAPGDCSLLLELQPGVRGRYRVTLRGSLSVEEAAVGVRMPDVSVQDVEHAQYKLAVAGGELAAEARGGLLHLLAPAKALTRWPGTAQRIERTKGQAWQIQGSEWQLRLLPHPRPRESIPVRIFLWEQSAAVVDGRHWLHEARGWLHHEAHTDLNVDFAAPVRAVAVAIDGDEVTPLQSSPSRLWLPLPGRAGVRCVRLRWQYTEGEPLDRPNLASPKVVDAVNGPTLWTVLAPAGWEPARSTPATRLGTGAAREGALALYRAEAQLRISQELCKQRRNSAATTTLTAAQRRFAHYCLHAQHALDMGAARGGVSGPAGQTLAEWLTKLQDENRELAEKMEGGGWKVEGTIHLPPSTLHPPPLERGMPISWQSRSGTEPPILQLTSRESQRIRQDLAASGQWLGLLVVVWMLSFLPFLMRRLRLFWPEQIALVGVVGWHLAGLTWVVLFLLLVAAWSRVFLLARGLRRLYRKRGSPPSGKTASLEGERPA